MRCKNPYCKHTGFSPVVEMRDNPLLVGVYCISCGARYSADEIGILDSVKREGWNSVKWGVKL